MSASTNPDIDEVIDDRYVIERPLGEGGMGTVFLARHTLTNRRVALKWVESSDKSLRQRLLREARAIAKVSHRSVVDVLDAGEHGSAVYIVLPFLHGCNLRAHASDRTLSPSEAVKLLMPAIEGVAAAHMAGILHRDLKPENLYVCKDADGVVFDTKVLDFGVAKQVLREVDNGKPKQTALTQAGHIVGTPEYMAPEQISHNPQLDERTDVYAMGIVLYELLAGRLPYETRELKALLLDIIKAEFPSPSRFREDLPAGLCKVVMTALHTLPSARYSSMQALGQALEPWADGRKFEPPRKLADPNDDVPLDAFSAETVHRSGSVPVAAGKTRTKKVAPSEDLRTRQGHARVDRSATPVRGVKSERGDASALRKPAAETVDSRGPIGTADTEQAPLPQMTESSARALPTKLSFPVIFALLMLSIALSAGVWWITREKPVPVPVAEKIQQAPVAPVVEPAPAPAATPAPQPTAPAAAPPAPVQQAIAPVEPAPVPVAPVEPAPKRRAKRAQETVTPAASESGPVEVKTRAGVFGAKDF